MDMAFDECTEAVQASSHSPQHSSLNQRDESSIYVSLAARDYEVSQVDRLLTTASVGLNW